MVLDDVQSKIMGKCYFNLCFFFPLSVLFIYIYKKKKLLHTNETSALKLLPFFLQKYDTKRNLSQQQHYLNKLFLCSNIIDVYFKSCGVGGFTRVLLLIGPINALV
jgi:predicted MPP superfamily phosphohydrolase